jgi:hypothetical protein
MVYLDPMCAGLALHTDPSMQGVSVAGAGAGARLLRRGAAEGAVYEIGKTVPLVAVEGHRIHSPALGQKKVKVQTGGWWS